MLYDSYAINHQQVNALTSHTDTAANKSNLSSRIHTMEEYCPACSRIRTSSKSAGHLNRLRSASSTFPNSPLLPAVARDLWALRVTRGASLTGPLSDVLLPWWWMFSASVSAASLIPHLCINEQCIVSWWCNSQKVGLKGRGFNPRPLCFPVTTLGKLFAHVCLCHQAV